MTIASELKKLVGEPEPPSSTHQATVLRTDSDGVTWVSIPGGAPETPVHGTLVETSPGDTVSVTIADGRATISGNATSPAATGRTVDIVKDVAMDAGVLANRAYNAAESAEEAAESAVASASTAASAASAAQASANAAAAAASVADGKAEQAASAASAASAAAALADAKADAAQASANAANTYSNAALDQLGVVQNVVGVLSWASNHGSFEHTSDTAIVAGKVYFTYDSQSGDYTPVVDPQASALSTYYELTVDEAMNSFIMAHLAVTSRGLWVLPSGVASGTTPASGESQKDSDARQASDYKVLLSNDGMSVYDGSGVLVVKYGANIQFDTGRGFVIGDTSGSNYISFVPGLGITIGGSFVAGEIISDNGASRWDLNTGEFTLVDDAQPKLTCDSLTQLDWRARSPQSFTVQPGKRYTVFFTTTASDVDGLKVRLSNGFDGIGSGGVPALIEESDGVKKYRRSVPIAANARSYSANATFDFSSYDWESNPHQDIVYTDIEVYEEPSVGDGVVEVVANQSDSYLSRTRIYGSYAQFSDNDLVTRVSPGAIVMDERGIESSGIFFAPNVDVQYDAAEDAFYVNGVDSYIKIAGETFSFLKRRNSVYSVSINGGDVTASQTVSCNVISSAKASIGNGSTAASSNQVAIGRYNVEDSSSTYPFIIGNGSSDTKANALAVNWDGSIYSWMKRGNVGYNQIASTQEDRYLNFLDKNGLVLARFYARQDTSGLKQAKIEARGKNSSGNDVWNHISANVAKDGTRSYSMSDPAAFCSALNVGNRVTKDQGTAVSIANSTYSNICSMSLTAGTWVIEGVVQFSSDATTGRRLVFFSTTSQSSSSTDVRQTGMSTNAVSGTTYVHTGCTKVFSGTTTLYIIGWQNSGSALNCYGYFSAVRIK